MGKLSIAASLSFVCGLYLQQPLAIAADQTASQEEARRIHDKGSDDSLKHSYKNALHAVDNFFDLNIPGAIFYGVKAYGQYKNSEKLDDLRDKNHALAGTMNSVNSAELLPTNGVNQSGPAGTLGPQSEGAKVEEARGVSPYMRIDPAFLREGEAAAIAAKVETLTGMKREKLFKMAAEIHTKNIHRSITDSDYLPNAIKAFHEAVEKTPSKEFREKMEKAEAAASITGAAGLFSKFKDATSTLFAAKSQEEKIAETDPLAAPKAEAVAPVEAPKPEVIASVEPLKEENREPASGADGKLLGLDRIKLEPVDGYLGDLMKSAAAEQEQVSIFKMVSAKIKTITSSQHLEQRVTSSSH